MDNIVEFPKAAATEELTEHDNVVQLNPMAELEVLVGKLERCCDDIHTNIMGFIGSNSITKIILNKRSSQDKAIRVQLVSLKILSKTKVKRLSARRLADFIRKSYWRINELEKRQMRNLVKLGDSYGYYDRKAIEVKALSEEQNKIIELSSKFKNKPFELDLETKHHFANSVSDPQDGTNLEVEDNFTNGIS